MSGNTSEIRNLTRVGAPRIRTWRERIGATSDFPLRVPSEVERAMEAEIAELRASWGAAGPINGIPATFRHDEGAIARCSYCGRYTLDRKALSDRQPVCECGKQNGWSGGFVKPGPDAKWNGKAPQQVEQAPLELPALDDELRAILGRQSFQCIHVAARMREMGHDIKWKAEVEQAAVIYLLLGFYLKHGAVDWFARANEYLAGATLTSEEGA